MRREPAESVSSTCACCGTCSFHKLGELYSLCHSLQNEITLARLRAALAQSAGEAQAQESFGPQLGG